ncbi:MAG: hypothetical protein ACHQNE_00810 [Candidatus Kapaibacterium sp.]
MTKALITLFCAAAIFYGCSTTYHVVDSAPDYISRDSLRNSINILGASPIIHPGKIISSGNFLFINEPYKGWHVIDNTTPSSPQNVAYITAPGSLDGTASQGVLYIENSVDLVVLNISDPAHPAVIRRLENVLPVPAAPHNPAGFYPNNATIIGWHDTVVTENIGPSFA